VNGIVTPETIIASVEEFKNLVVEPHMVNNPKLKISLQLRIETREGNIRSISYLDTINYGDFDELLDAYITI
jgi:hypothetical protein